jgi:hypothetical protein
LHSLSSKLSLTLSTHTKACASLCMTNLALGGIRYDLLIKCIILLCTSTQSSNLKWVSGGSINSPRCSKSHWLKAAENSTIRWSDAMLFQVSVHPVLLVVALHCTWLLTQIIRRFNRCTVVSSGVEDSATKTSLLAYSRVSDEPLLHCQFIRCYCLLNRLLFDLNSRTVGWTAASPSVHPVLKTPVLAHYCLVQTSNWIDRQPNEPDRWFIQCYWVLWAGCYLSSLNHLTLLELGSSIHPMVPFYCFLASLTCLFASFDCGCIHGT